MRSASAEPPLMHDDIAGAEHAPATTSKRLRALPPTLPQLQAEASDLSGISFLADARAEGRSPTKVSASKQRYGMPSLDGAGGDNFSDLLLPPPVSLGDLESRTRDELNIVDPTAVPRIRHSDSSVPDALSWHVTFSDGVFGFKPRPSGRSNVFHVERWLKAKVSEAQQEKLQTEQERTRDATAYGEIEGWRMREPERTYLKRVHRLYGTAHEELVRQVSSHCVERATLLTSIWHGIAAIHARLCDQEVYASDVVGSLLTRYSDNETEMEDIRRKQAELRLKANTADALERQVREMQSSMDLLVMERDSLRNTVKLQEDEHSRSLAVLRKENDDGQMQRVSLQVEVDKLREQIKNLDTRRQSMMQRRRSSIAAPAGSVLQLQLESLEEEISTMTPRPQFDMQLLPNHLRDPGEKEEGGDERLAVGENMTLRRVQALEAQLREQQERAKKLDAKARMLEEQVEASKKPTASERSDGSPPMSKAAANLLGKIIETRGREGAAAEAGASEPNSEASSPEKRQLTAEEASAAAMEAADTVAASREA